MSPTIVQDNTPIAAGERCDQCAHAAATVRVTLTRGELYLCSHHARLHLPALERQALAIRDERNPR